jgi:hypothetical protein
VNWTWRVSLPSNQHAPYDPAQTTWFKIRNRNYSQIVGREEYSRESDIESRFRGGMPAL